MYRYKFVHSFSNAVLKIIYDECEREYIMKVFSFFLMEVVTHIEEEAIFGSQFMVASYMVYNLFGAMLSY